MSIIIFSVILVFSFHYIRTYSQSRYEAVTFECIVVSMYISLANLFFFGLSYKNIYLYTTVILAGMLALNAFHQYKYLKLMKDRIKKAVNDIIADIRKTQNKNSDKTADLITKSSDSEQNSPEDVRISYYDNLREIGLIVIAPTFSSFIEENELFNNPGGMIGMTKAMLGGRKRFHKKKYEMRERIAELLNLAGPYVSQSGSEELQIVKPRDLALEVKDEKGGLIRFDLVGFLSFLVFFAIVILSTYKHSFGTAGSFLQVNLSDALIFTGILIGLGLFTWAMRQIAFGRKESPLYEVASSFMIVSVWKEFWDLTQYKALPDYRRIIVLAIIFILWILISFICIKSNKKIHKAINYVFDDINKKLDQYEDKNSKINDQIKEIIRIRRLCVQNLQAVTQCILDSPFAGKDHLDNQLGKMMSMLNCIVGELQLGIDSKEKSDNNKKGSENPLLKKYKEDINQVVFRERKYKALIILITVVIAALSFAFVSANAINLFPFDAVKTFFVSLWNMFFSLI